MTIVRSCVTAFLAFLLIKSGTHGIPGPEVMLLGIMLVADILTKLVDSKDIGRVAPLLGLCLVVESPSATLAVSITLVAGGALLLSSRTQIADLFCSIAPIMGAGLVATRMSPETTLGLWPGLMFLALSLFFEPSTVSLRVPVHALVSSLGLAVAFQHLWPEHILACIALLPLLVSLAFGGNLQKNLFGRIKGLLNQKDQQIVEEQKARVEVEQKAEELSQLLTAANLMARTLKQDDLECAFAKSLAQVGAGEWKFTDPGSGEISIPGSQRELLFKRGLLPAHRPALEVLIRIFATCQENVRLHAQTTEALAETERSQAQMLESHRLAAMGRLAAGVAHEMNSPLGAILMTAEFAKALLPANISGAKEKMDRIVESVQVAQANVTRLLEYSRPESRSAPSLLCAGQIVGDVLRLLEWQAAKSKVTVQADVHSEAKVLINQQAFHTILSNLVLNGIQAATGQTPAEVSVVLCTRDGFHRFRFQDTGEGVSPDVVGQLFQPFFTTKPMGEGNGLGLYLAKQAAEEAGGTLLLLESERGALFELCLPMPD